MGTGGGNIIVSHSWQSPLCIRWTVTGKVSDVIRTEESNKPKLHFDYDAMGQRIAKKVTNKNVTTGDKFVTTYYMCDPQGNVLAVYERQRGETDDGIFTLTEQHLYGASRLGMKKRNLALSGSAVNESTPSVTLYELTNHLSNVVAVISDEDNGSSNEPKVESLTDYYPFGMEMGGRNYNSNDYRFGYTGHEKENDLAEGVYTTQYRLLDTRLGRWMSVDPLFAKYPDMSAYNYCGGNPVVMVDLKGDKIYIYMQKIKKIDRDKPYSKDCRVSYNKLKKMSMQEIGEKYGEFVKETFMALNILKGTKAFKDIFKNYNSRKYNLEIFYCGPNEDVHCSPGDDNTCCMQYNHRKADIGVITDENGSYLTVAMPPLSSILHEGAEFFKCNMTYGKKDNDYMLYEKEMDEGPEISKTGFKKNDSWNGQNDNYIMEYYETELARELYGLPGDKFYRNRHGGLVPYECTSATSIEPTEKGQEQLERLIKDKDLQK